MNNDLGYYIAMSAVAPYLLRDLGLSKQSLLNVDSLINALNQNRTTGSQDASTATQPAATTATTPATTTTTPDTSLSRYMKSMPDMPFMGYDQTIMSAADAMSRYPNFGYRQLTAPFGPYLSMDSSMGSSVGNMVPNNYQGYGGMYGGYSPQSMYGGYYPQSTYGGMGYGDMGYGGTGYSPYSSYGYNPYSYLSQPSLYGSSYLQPQTQYSNAYSPMGSSGYGLGGYGLGGYGRSWY